MGVSSVPGGGKTLTLSFLAAEILSSGVLQPGQEVLIVTLVNSAVENFSNRVAGFVKAKGLIPGVSYRVRTLHGLAHDIVRERPELAGLSDRFQIVDELAAERILNDIIHAWIRGRPRWADLYLDPQLSEKDLNRVLRYGWPEMVRSIASSLIRQAKDERISPDQIRARLDRSPKEWPLLEMGWSIYDDYQRSLGFRGAVDFDDLIGKALDCLESDDDYLQRLRYRWPFVLEDEAQDSSSLQETTLRQLVGSQGNWVRMGDTNQAIFESFTTASPDFLRSFLLESDVTARNLPNSGRSTLSVIRLANALIDWSRELGEPHSALTLPHIEPSPPGDPQPNPVDSPKGVKLVPNAYTPEEEVRAVGISLERWLADNPHSTAAVLVPANRLGIEYADEFRAREIRHIELLRSTRATRRAAGAVGSVLAYLAKPDSTRDLLAVYRIWEARHDGVERQSAEAALRKVGRIERFIWPRSGDDWLLDLNEDDPLKRNLSRFREQLQYWQAASTLPIDQLVLTLAHDLFVDPADIALAYKISGVLRRASDGNPAWGLAELSNELKVVAKNERRFLGVGPDDRGFDADSHAREVVITTIHKAKGLEWDRVHLVSVNNYDYPTADPGDRFVAEKWFVRGGLNLPAESLHQLKALVQGKLDQLEGEGEATAEARLEYASERLRLLYVGITRARKELIITWNLGRQGDLKMATSMAALLEGIAE